ncbi:hypothetical protein [Azohydromonas lata]|uniref:hypothetical protein n=1 Tax=Azohydromonas lata TaxID=45677 RepID=UPI0012F4CD57|nr:hypothetical protein [Azohydromonas lata]
MTRVKRALNVDAVIKPQRPGKAFQFFQVLRNGMDRAGQAHEYLVWFAGKY